MQVRRVIPGAAGFALLFFALLFACVLPGDSAPTQDRRQEKDYETVKPAAVHAPALVYAAKMEETAPGKIKDWCRDQAKKMASQPIDPRAAMQTVDREFPKYNDAERDAIIYLLIYFAYRDEETQQALLASEIKRLDDDVQEILFQTQRMKESEQNRMISTRSMPSQQELIRNEETARRNEEKLKEIALSRRNKMRDLGRSRKRVEGYLKVIAVTYPRMDGVPADVLRNLS